jgi:hypothetical protein
MRGDTLAADWKPEQYRDTHTDVLRGAIQQKIEGKEITSPAAKPRAEVVDLMETLRRSLEEGGKRKPSAPTRAEAPARAAASACRWGAVRENRGGGAGAENGCSVNRALVSSTLYER